MSDGFPQIPGERYQLTSLLGRGGMAEVYRADDLNLGRQVAVKVPNEKLLKDQVSVERFRREAQAAAGLAHPNIVRIYDFVDDDKCPCLVMELIEGEDLGSYLSRVQSLDTAECLRLAEQILDAIAYAHDQGLIHRDLSPHNILLDGVTGQAKVSDFGIARALGDKTLTDTGQMVGSVATMSPEQAQGEKVDHRADLYAVGCLLYLMSTGELPFRGDNPVQVALKHVGEVPVSPAKLNPELPESLVDTILTALKKDPDQRFASARDMKAALQGRPLPKQALAPTVVRPAPVASGTAVAAGDPPRTRRSVLPWVLLLLLMVTGAGLYMGSEYIKQRPQVPELSGMSIEEARSACEQLGLRLVVGEERENDEVPKGQILSQSPPGGVVVWPGDSVTVHVSAGPSLVEVPRLAGLTESQASDKLKDLRLVSRIREEPDPVVPVGVVKSQEPPPGTKVSRDTVVTLVVSSGNARLLVPSVLGFSEEEARRTLEGLGLVMEVTDYRADASVAEGTVLSQNPSAGAKVVRGRKVFVVLSRGATDLHAPELEGKTISEARSIVSEMGLELVIEGEAGADDPIVFQDPPPGDPIKDPRISVRTAPSSVVPLVQGMTEAEARQELQAAGLAVGEVRTVGGERFDEVVSQDPLPGIEVPPGTVVDLFVSDPNIKDVPEPTGTPLQSAPTFTPAPWIE